MVLLVNWFLGGMLLPVASAIKGKSFTGWDCCKPACAWRATVPTTANGLARTCDVFNNPMSNGASVKSGCDGGYGYLCANYAPVPVEEKLSYGFAITMAANNCCKCYKLIWTSGSAAGKQMIVQSINVGAVGNGVSQNDIVVLTPGGGVGPHSRGCEIQYGSTWGPQDGGVSDRTACAYLPSNLQGGCYWRFNWARGDINNWDIEYDQVACPERLTSISGCSA